MSYILASIAIAFFISYIYSWFMEKCTGVLVTAVIAGFFAILVFLTISCKQNWNENKVTLENTDPSDKDQYEKIEKMVKLFTILYYSLLVISILFACTICCLIPRILLAIKIIQACAEFVLEVKAIVLVPIVVTVLTFGYITFWGYWTGLTFSQGTLIHLQSLPFMSIEINKTIRNELLLNLFALLWVLSFLLASSHFIVAASACIWYNR